MHSAALRRFWAVVPAAGQGSRFAASSAAAPKQYAQLLGRSMLEWSLAPLLAEPRIRAVVVALAPHDGQWPAIESRLANHKLITTIGGADRHASVMHGLAALSRHAPPEDWVLVHDAARPCLSAADLTALLDSLERSDQASGALLAVPVVDTVRRAVAGRLETLDREGLWRAQTPQAFGLGPLQQALDAAAAAGVRVTDEAQAMERIGVAATLVASSPFNIKVTRSEDLQRAEEILRMSDHNEFRIGQGIDVHAYGEGDHVILGGVRIAHSRGVIAHSDGDVVIHALCDALLGALGDGDIGQHFPDTDPRYRGADSRVFLRVVAERLRARGARVVNADITVLAQAPRVAAHRGNMAANLAADLAVDGTLINIKATTTERLGYIGREEGLAAQATVLLSLNRSAPSV